MDKNNQNLNNKINISKKDKRNLITIENDSRNKNVNNNNNNEENNDNNDIDSNKLKSTNKTDVFVINKQNNNNNKKESDMNSKDELINDGKNENKDK